MRKQILFTIILLFLIKQLSFSQTILFEEDFSSYSTSSWASDWCTTNPSSNYFSASSDYAWRVYTTSSATNYYITTVAIVVPAGGSLLLDFDYKYDYTFSQPTIEISTSSCASGFTLVETLPGGVGSLTAHSIDLSAYVGQTIYIKFLNHVTYEDIWFDNIILTYTAGTGGESGGSTSCSDIFLEDFGSSYSGTHLLSNWSRASSYANDNFSACDGYSWYSYGSGKYVITNSIIIPATGTSTLDYDYKFNKTYSFPSVEISTTGEYGLFTTIHTMVNQGSCTTESIDLSAYSGEVINIRFYTSNSSGTFILDNVHVQNCPSSGTAIVDLKWADNFNDNNLDLDYPGNNGDEQFAGQSWDLGTASLVSGSQIVNRTETEAFTSSQSQGYSIQIDKGEYFESPTMDLSAQEGFKISFYADIFGGAYSDWFGSHVDLKIWDGSSWVLAMQLDGNSHDSEDLMASGFGYHCYTAYKSSTSPGNYYPNLGVNPAFFHPGFKFRIEIQGWGTVSAHIDNVTFRADDNGETLIPCGVSYWNSAEAIHYGRDPDASVTNHSARGLELEVNDLYNVGTPPDWSGHCNDGNTGNSSQNTIVWAAISEQKISSNSSKVMFIHNDGTGIENANMSIDNTYPGPGYLYYLKEFSQCNSTNSSFYDTGQGLNYHFLFEYGSDFKPVFYHLNSTGIEAGGGQTELPEYNNPEICDMWLPVEITSFEGTRINKTNLLSWSTASEFNNSHFNIERSKDGINYNYIGEINGFGNSNKKMDYTFTDENPKKGNNYYRLRQVDYDGVWKNSNIINITNNSINFKLSILKNRIVKVEFTEPYCGNIKIYNTTGQVITQETANQVENIEIPILKKGIFIIQFSNSEKIFTEKLIIH